MESFLSVNWQDVWGRDTPLLEIVVRGTVMYFGLFVLMRLMLKRQAGTVGISDVLVIVLIADAAQNGMSGNYHSVPDGLLLVAVIMFWSFSLDWLSFRFPVLRSWLEPPPLLLVKDGKPLRRNMRRELISMDELHAQLREKGIERLDQVKAAFIEADGHISVIANEMATQRQGKEREADPTSN
ncbi:MAG: DUF421 domain-containing protein [Rickettsiales bacterium]|nr:DUF421 domain-containing protein [Rickettsiales bacterium]